MAGPTAGVLLRDPIDEQTLDRLMSLAFLPSGTWSGDWYIEDPAALGMPAELAQAGAVGVGLRQPSGLPALTEALGFTPPLEIAVWMWCNQDVDHRMLGYLCLAFAIQYDGLVDFYGRINTPPSGFVVTGMNERQRRAELDSEIARRVRRLPGRLYLVNYGSRTNPRYSHIGDAVFTEGWLRHPRFRMIK
ncbi:hypothetical protein DFR70_10581 [Nocardia tenerifensis]|uniref:Uncharacterized protein n=2 Tax=Nocardia tenerifensis TaxID=228006 RepID=A0A318JZL7_9NOCA|nr:DUF6368 family protein [Nocardia tenerifensis]PXX63899.1 hypothetical protein DFR70_10581 [Nocardia tenerifensis]